MSALTVIGALIFMLFKKFIRVKDKRSSYFIRPNRSQLNLAQLL